MNKIEMLVLFAILGTTAFAALGLYEWIENEPKAYKAWRKTLLASLKTKSVFFIFETNDYNTMQISFLITKLYEMQLRFEIHDTYIKTYKVNL